MIIVVLAKERNPKTGFYETRCSHGINEKTGQQIVLPWITPEEAGAVFCNQRQEWVLREK